MVGALVVEDDRTNDVPPCWPRRKPGEPAGAGTGATAEARPRPRTRSGAAPSDACRPCRLVHLGRHVDQLRGVACRALEIQQDLRDARPGMGHQVLDDLGHTAVEGARSAPPTGSALYLALARAQTPTGRSRPRSAARSCTRFHCSASWVAPMATGIQPSARSTRRRVALGLFAGR